VAKSKIPASAPSLIWILGLLGAFGPMSVDMYLPALPAIGDDLVASTGSVQLTLSAFFVGFALGQLAYGPLSDRFGRRPMLISGIGLYVVTSAMCALSPDIESLIGYRLLHALGGGAGTVVARAVVRDHFDTDQGARVLSFMMLVTGVAPLLAPIAGGYVLKWLGWRAIFWLLSGFGALALMTVVIALPESNPPERRARSRLLGVFTGYVAVIRSAPALGSILSGGAAFAGMFAYISGTPFVYIELFGVAPEHYGYLFGLNIVGMMIGAFLNGRLVVRYGAPRLMAIGTVLAAVSGAILVVTAWSGAGGLIGIVIPLLFYLASLSVIGANAIARAAANFPERAGAVAALFGATQFGLGAVAGSAVGQLHDGSPVPMAAVIAACGVLSLLADRALTK
jgi:DHA1 family bicyclomycin/chloramphenicol resistance-like MFS transporter